jgi:hypothetical protein
MHMLFQCDVARQAWLIGLLATRSAVSEGRLLDILNSMQMMLTREQ